MKNSRTWRYLRGRIRQHGSIIFAIVDSDKHELVAIGPLIRSLERVGIDAVLVGGTTLRRGYEHYYAVFRELRTHVKRLPLIIFPGGMGMYRSITTDADSMLFLQLISGIGYRYFRLEQLMSAPKLDRLGLDSISVGYMLVSSPAVEPACRLSQTRPLKLTQAYDAMALTAWSECVGKQMVWFDRGSNAPEPIPPWFFWAIRHYNPDPSSPLLPIMVCGGLKTAEQISGLVETGVAMVGVGTVIEQTEDVEETLAPLVKAAHWKGGKAVRKP